METDFMNAFLFSDIPNLQRATVRKKLTSKRLLRGQILFHQGSVGDAVYVIQAGSLEIFVENSERKFVLGHQFAGEVVGELEMIHSDARRTASVGAMENSLLWQLKREDLETLMTEYPLILRRIAATLAERLQQADRKLSYFAFMDARLRVVNLLVDLAANFGVSSPSGTVVDWLVTKQHLADMVGLNRESMSRALSDLQREGLLTWQNRHLCLPDLRRLEVLAETATQVSKGRLWHTPSVLDRSEDATGDGTHVPLPQEIPGLFLSRRCRPDEDAQRNK